MTAIDLRPVVAEPTAAVALAAEIRQLADLVEQAPDLAEALRFVLQPLYVPVMGVNRAGQLDRIHEAAAALGVQARSAKSPGTVDICFGTHLTLWLAPRPEITPVVK